MGVKSRNIEVDASVADTLEAWAAERGFTLSEFLADLAQLATGTIPATLETERAQEKGAWAPEVLAEDAARLAQFEETGAGVPFAEVSAWMKSWGTSKELPSPKSRKL